jgi:hypothetical protein
LGYDQGLRSGHDKQNGATVTSRKKGRKPPFEVLFAVWVMMAAIAVFDILGVLAILEVAKEPKPAWVPWLFGFILLLLSVIAASFVQTLKDGDRTMRYYLSVTVPLWGFGFSWPPSWSWLLFLVPIAIVGPLWLPRARRFFDEAPDESSFDAAGPRAPGPTP